MKVEPNDSPARYSNQSTIGDRPPSLAAVQAVAALRGVEPTEMDDRLYDYVDPDAFDLLISGSGGPTTIEIPMGDEVVQIWSDGRLEVREEGR